MLPIQRIFPPHWSELLGNPDHPFRPMYILDGQQTTVNNRLEKNKRQAYSGRKAEKMMKKLQ